MCSSRVWSPPGVRCLLPSVLVLLLGSSQAFAAWEDGHVGLDRPGGDLPGMPIETDSVQACARSCLSTPACRSYSFHSFQCAGVANPTGAAAGGACRLKHAVPRAQHPPAFTSPGSSSSGCVVVSGTKAAEGGLLALEYSPLPLGDLAPTGWLLRQLGIMADGLTGHLDLFWPDVQESVWIGGTHDHGGAGHERGPYWLVGTIPLAAHLNASEIGSDYTVISDQVATWVHYILDHQLASGWLGPDDGFGGKGNDYWSGWNVAASLLEYADAHSQGDPALAARCNKAALDYVLEVTRRMRETPLTAWSQNRWQDWVYIIHWLLDQAPQGQEQALWDAAELAQEQSWDWDAYYDRTGVARTGANAGQSMPMFPLTNVSSWSMFDHGVNNAMGTKSCAVWYRQSRNVTELARTATKLSQQEFHGQPYGMFSADECFGGRALNRGIELCAVVEQMYSLEHIFRVTGDPAMLDRCERIAFNALPGTLTPSMWQHQYLQQANEINAKYNITDHVWQTDGVDSTGFGVEPNFGCCTANLQQGWPKLVSNVIFTKSFNTIAVGVLAPVKADIELPLTGVVHVEVVTDYPFGDDVEVQLDTGKVAGLDLHLRIPGWADKATVQVNGQTATAAKNGTMHQVHLPPGKTTVLLQLNPEVRVESGWGLTPSSPEVKVTTNAAAVLRGSLLYSLHLEEEWTQVKVWPTFNNVDVNMETNSTWNLALVLDAAHPLRFERVGPSGNLPFNISGFPSVIHATARAIPSWVENSSAADEPPPSPIDCKTIEGGCGPEVAVVLVPYGATDLRMAGMPWIE